MDEQELERRLGAIEQQLAVLSQRLGVPYGAGTPVGAFGGMPLDIVELARSGNKLEAIKRYRELTGVGLKEAKDAIEAL